MAENSALSEASKASLSANTTLSQNLGNANSAFDSIASSADESIDSLLKSAFNTLRSTNFEGVTGLETQKVTNMQTAITNYVNSIKSALDPLNGSDATKAFGNQMNQKIQEFVESVKSSCQAIVSNMEAFNDDLTAVKTAMENKAQSVNTTVGTQSSNLSSSQSSWTYSGNGTH